MKIRSRRYSRGDWSVPKADASTATIGVDPTVIARLHRLKDLIVEVRAGRAVRKYKVVKSAGPDDLVFQSVKDRRPMADQNILKRRQATHPAGGPKARVTVRQLASAHIPRDLDDPGWS
jgi:hypothetical protein